MLKRNNVSPNDGPPANSNSQCLGKYSFPAFELNRDGRSIDADVAIFENFMRGYHTTAPLNELL